MSVQAHYDRLLGPVYSWMVGDLDAATARADGEIDAIGLPLREGGIAVDLGAGFGLHALPLARRGYQVIAIDNCQPLLQELRLRANALPIRVIDGNLLDFPHHLRGPADVILCMGDTLTHLPDVAAVDALFDAAAAALSPGGLFVASFRDYVAAPLQGDARFIPVRSDEHRILTCFLEYSQHTVRVHDLLHERLADRWELKVSSYPKLRLAPDWVIKSLENRGLSVRRETGLGGMVRVVARQNAAGN